MTDRILTEEESAFLRALHNAGQNASSIEDLAESAGLSVQELPDVLIGLHKMDQDLVHIQFRNGDPGIGLDPERFWKNVGDVVITEEGSTLCMLWEKLAEVRSSPTASLIVSDERMMDLLRTYGHGSEEANERGAWALEGKPARPRGSSNLRREPRRPNKVPSKRARRRAMTDEYIEEEVTETSETPNTLDALKTAGLNQALMEGSQFVGGASDNAIRAIAQNMGYDPQSPAVSTAANLFKAAAGAAATFLATREVASRTAAGQDPSRLLAGAAQAGAAFATQGLVGTAKAGTQMALPVIQRAMVNRQLAAAQSQQRFIPAAPPHGYPQQAGYGQQYAQPQGYEQQPGYPPQYAPPMPEPMPQGYYAQQPGYAPPPQGYPPQYGTPAEAAPMVPPQPLQPQMSTQAQTPVEAPAEAPQSGTPALDLAGLLGNIDPGTLETIMGMAKSFIPGFDPEMVTGVLEQATEALAMKEANAAQMSEMERELAELRAFKAAQTAATQATPATSTVNGKGSAAPEEISAPNGRASSTIS